MAFGTDDEEALENAFNHNFERSTHLLCEIHLKKNLERKLVELGIMGQVKHDIISDVFGRQIGDVFESGLTDASSQEDFDNLLEVLKERWSNAHDNGTAFHDWFVEHKAREFVECVISSVRQRAGLGCPPERFITNRSERTNGVIQQFVKEECDGKKVDEYVFAVTLQKLVKIQERDVELAVIGQGEFTIRERFNHISVPASHWSKMTEKKKNAALQKIHTTALKDGADSNAIAFSRELQGDHPLIETFSKAGIDWIPHDMLVHMIRKASTLEVKVYVLPEAELQTAIVPSASSPNGKCECQDCAGYSSAFVCAHTIATCVKLNRLDAFLKWLVTTKRKTAGINYSKAISHGLPTGRGRKPNKAPRTKSKTNPPAQDNITVVPRLSQQPSCSPVLQPVTQPVNVGLPQQSVLGPTSQFQGEFSIPNHQTPVANQLPYNYPVPSNLISHSYPSPERDTFVVYLLGMCPQRTRP